MMPAEISDLTALSQLSSEALRSAVNLGDQDVSTLFEHLYTYHSIPLSSRWLERFPDTQAIRKELGLHSGSRTSRLLSERWLQMRAEVENGWLAWVRPRWTAELGSSRSEFKLYVSPAVEALAEVFPELVRVLTFFRARSFKVGTDAEGLLRPDKLVAHFSSLGDLANAAHELGLRIEGVPPQGVPFTAEIFGDGLLSWGVDPPPKAVFPGKIVPSWREWVCYRLAVAIIEARQKGDGPEPLWQQALERLRGDGVQVDRWLPSPACWGAGSW